MKKSKIFCPTSKEELSRALEETGDLRNYQCTTISWKQQDVWGDAPNYQESIKYSPHLWELRRY